MQSPDKLIPVRRSRRLGVPAIAFLIVAASAPLTVVAGGATTTFSVTHVSGVPFSFIVLSITLALFAVCYAAMSRHITNAGAFYAYVAQGIGRPAGVGAAFVAFVSYNAMQIGIYGLFGFQASMFIQEKTGVHIPWWATVLLCIAVTAFFGVNRIDLSVKVLAILVSVEFLLVVVFDISALLNPAQGISLEPFSPTALFVPAAGATLAFGIAAFMGFEGAAIYGEEAKDPHRTVPRATFLALIVIGVFYAFSSWALAVAVGVDKILSPDGIKPEEAGPPLIFNFVATHLGPVWVDLMSVFFITSLFASLVSFHNAVARYTFSLAREGVLPRPLAGVGRSGAPRAGSLLQTGLAAIVIAAFAVAGTNSPFGDAFPVVTLFSWLPNAGAMGLVLLMALVSAAVIGFFWREQRGVNIWVRLVVPVLSVLTLGAVFVLILLNFDVLLGQTERNAVSFLLPAIIIIPGIVGVGVGLRMRRDRPELYRGLGHGGDRGVSALEPEPDTLVSASE